MLHVADLILKALGLIIAAGFVGWLIEQAWRRGR